MGDHGPLFCWAVDHRRRMVGASFDVPWTVWRTMTDVSPTPEKPKTAEHVPSLDELQRVRDVLAEEAATGRQQAAELVAVYDRKIADLKRKQGLAD
jgi:hypothetical protein